MTKILPPSLPTILSNEIFRSELKTFENNNTDETNKKPTFTDEPGKSREKFLNFLLILNCAVT